MFISRTVVWRRRSPSSSGCPNWDTPTDTGRLSWSLFRRDSDGTAGTPFDDGYVDFGIENFPALAVFRFEADTDGALRLLFQGTLLTTTIDRTLPPTRCSPSASSSPSIANITPGPSPTGDRPAGTDPVRVGGRRVPRPEPDLHGTGHPDPDRRAP